MSQPFDPYRRWLGILPAEMPPNHYRLLGLSLFEADPEVIEQAADRQISHVQRHKQGEGGGYADALLAELAAARLCLLKPETRAAYDHQLRTRQATSRLPQAVPAPTPPPAPPPASPPAAPAQVLPVAQARPVPTPAPVRALPVEPVAAPLDFVGDNLSSASPRRRKRAAARANSNSAVVAGAVLAAGLCICVIGWAVLKAGSAKPPVEKPAAAAAAPAPPQEKPAAAKAAPEQPPADGSSAPTAVDLLALVKLDRDVVDGRWRKAGKRLLLATTPAGHHARLQIPYYPPAEYQLDMTVSRQNGAEVDVGLVIGGRQVVAIIDGYQNTASGLDLVDNRPASEGSTAHRGPLLVPGRPALVRYTVKRGSIQVVVNDSQVIDWHGAPKQVSLNGARFGVPDKRTLLLAGNGSGYTISRLELTPITGTGKAIDPPSAALATTGNRGGDGENKIPAAQSEEEPATTGAVAPRAFSLPSGGFGRAKSVPYQPPDPATLVDVPDEAAQAETLKLVREVYADAYKQAKKSAEKAALAERLLADARKSENPAEQFVLYREARTFAVSGASPGLVVQVIQELGGRFKIATDEMIAENLDELNHETLPGTVRKELAESLLPVAEREIDMENFALARRLLTLALNAAKKTNDKPLVKDVSARAADLAELRRAAEGVKAAQKVLDEKSDDPQANLTMGKYLALFKDDWGSALPHLSLGSDAGLQEVAQLELTAAAAPDEQVKIADTWWALAEASKGHEKTGYQARAAHWYKTAMPGLKGLMQTKVAKRLEELSAAGKPKASAAPGAATATSEKPAGPPKSLSTRIKHAVKKELLTRSRMGGTGGGEVYLDVSDVGLLVGFNYTVVQRANNNGYIASIQPIYQSSRGFATGRVYGIPVGEAQTVKAKKGYAVASLQGAMFHYLYGMEVIFNAVDAAGNLNPADNYTSEWQGFGQQYVRTTVGGGGLPIVGIFGTGGDYPTGLGLVQLPK